MYRRSNNKVPEYRTIINNKENTKIDLKELNIDGNGGECLVNIQNALDSYYSVEDYIDAVFEKDIKTNYNPRKKGIREIDFVIDSAPVEVIEDDEKMEIIPLKNRNKKRVKRKNLQSTLVLQEAEEAIEMPEEKPEEFVLEDIIFPEEQLEITPVKKSKTRKQREQKLMVNPHGKKGTRRKRLLDENIAIKEGSLEIH